MKHLNHTKSKLLTIFPFIWIITTYQTALFAQIVSNDACFDAYDFGAMINGIQECYASNNIGANAELPYINQGYCFGAGDVPVPAADVWFQFTAAGNLLDILITSELDTLMIALYEGTCDALIGRKCAVVPGAGFISTTFAPVTTGQSYYLQISGGSVSDVGEYNLCLTSYQVETDICIIDQTISLDPLPYLGTYLKNQTVHVCLTIGGYFQNASDWFDGLVPVFGDGWDVSTLQVFPPPSCDGTNAWEWYDSVTGTGNNSPGTVGPGFFYDLNNDGNPGNDYGDAGNCGWTFCMDITTKDCPPADNADDLSIEFINYSDSEAGSWNAAGSPCVNDPNYVMKALLTCCPIPLMSGIPPTCLDSQSGSVTATSDSEPPMTFVWSNGFTETTMGTSTLSGVSVGFHSVTVTDNNDCTQVASFELENAAIPYIATDYIQPSTCASGNGQINLSIYNGVFPYTAVLTNDTTSESFTQTTTVAPPNATVSFTNLVGGLYSVVVTDAAGCSNTLGVEVEYVPALTVTAQAVNVSCPGATDGSITITAAGIPPFIYGINGGVLGSSNVFNNLAEGTYSIEVADNPILDCHITIEVIVGNNGSISGNAVSQPETCLGAANGSVTISGNNGELPYLYSINSGSFQSDSVFNNLTSGNYTYIVQDNNGCTFDSTFVITANTSPTANTTQLSEILCAGGNEASVAIHFSGGAMPYTYALNDGATQSDSIFSNLSSGTYNYSATDANGCMATGTFSIASPALLSINAGSDQSIIQGESANLAVSTISGTPTSYTWLPIDYLSCNDCLSAISTPPTTTTYTVTATDANGCTAIDSVTIAVLPAVSLLLPSAFSPNGDGLNDFFKPTVRNIPTYSLAIFNRWGQKVYEGNQSDAGWDGQFNDTPQELGVYVYHFNGIDASGNETFEQGNVAIIK